MSKKIRGFIKNAGTMGEAALVGQTSGYHETWDTGVANATKKRQKLTGINRPST